MQRVLAAAAAFLVLATGAAQAATVVAFDVTVTDIRNGDPISATRFAGIEVGDVLSGRIGIDLPATGSGTSSQVRFVPNVFSVDGLDPAFLSNPKIVKITSTGQRFISFFAKSGGSRDPSLRIFGGTGPANDLAVLVLEDILEGLRTATQFDASYRDTQRVTLFGSIGSVRVLPPVPGDDDVNVIPLPAAGWLMLAGLGALGLARRRR